MNHGGNPLIICPGFGQIPDETEYKDHCELHNFHPNLTTHIDSHSLLHHPFLTMKLDILAFVSLAFTLKVASGQGTLAQIK